MEKSDKMADQLLSSLSLLGEIGESIASSGSNFSSLSKEVLQIILEVMDISTGAILFFDQDKNKFEVEVAVGMPENGLEFFVEDVEINYFLESSIIDFSEQFPKIHNEESREDTIFSTSDEFIEFVNRNKEQIKALKPYLWAPMKISDNLLGIISLGKPIKNDLEHWDKELIKVISTHTAIVVKNSQLVEDSRKTNFRLFRLSDITAQISSLFRAEELENEIVFNAVSLLDARSGCIMLINSDNQKLVIHELFGLDESLYGLSINEEHWLQEVIENGKSIVVNTTTLDSIFGESKILASPIKGMEETLGILVVCDRENRDGKIVDFTEDDELLLSALANQAGINIENARLYQEALDLRSIRADMEAAANIQRNFLPDKPPELPGYEFAGMSVPHGGVGGDYYDFIDEGDGHLGVVIADVSGKGTQAALLMATFRANLLTETKREKDLEKIARLLNTLIYESSPEEKYVTFFYGRLYPNERIVEYINAGHNPPIIVRKDGNLEYTQGHSAFVGTFPPEIFDLTVNVENNRIMLENGDLIVFYTDGVTEATNINDEQFGEERLETILKENYELNAEEMKKLIYEKVIEFQGDAPPFDDLTLIVLKKNF